MVPSPPLWAVLGDVLLCLGAGLLLGAVRDGATLGLWQRPGAAALCGMCWPLLPQPLSAAASRRGLRLPGRRAGIWPLPMGLGALCWRWCVSHAVHRALRGTVFVLVWPLRFAADYAVHPFKQWLLARIRKIRHAGGATHKIHARKAEKSRKMCCKTSAQYYIIKLYLSMPA